MLKTKMINKISLLRLVAFVAIVSFSFEITSAFFVQDDLQIEIVDADLEDDTQDEEFDSSYLYIEIEVAEIVDSQKSETQSFLWPLKDQHLDELTTPPPDKA